MGRAKVFLTLNLPAKGLAAGTPVVASYNPRLLRLFKSIVLEEWERRVANDFNDILAEIDCLEYEKLKATLDLLVPDDGVGNGDDEAQA